MVISVSHSSDIITRDTETERVVRRIVGPRRSITLAELDAIARRPLSGIPHTEIVIVISADGQLLEFTGKKRPPDA